MAHPGDLKVTEPRFSIHRDKHKIQELKKMSNNQFPMMHCAKALYSTDGDLDKALIWVQQNPVDGLVDYKL
jgi:translation elongation factor EF-Ts